VCIPLKEWSFNITGLICCVHKSGCLLIFRLVLNLVLFTGIFYYVSLFSVCLKALTEIDKYSAL
jgi:hypothetical protein